MSQNDSFLFHSVPPFANYSADLLSSARSVSLPLPSSSMSEEEEEKWWKKFRLDLTDRRDESPRRPTSPHPQFN